MAGTAFSEPSAASAPLGWGYSKVVRNVLRAVASKGTVGSRIMSRGDEPSADPTGPSPAELASELTGLRTRLDSAIRDFEAVRAEAEAKVLALHSHLKQISAGMSTLEAAISTALAASDTGAGTVSAPGADDNEAGDQAPATTENDTAGTAGDDTPGDAQVVTAQEEAPVGDKMDDAHVGTDGEAARTARDDKAGDTQAVTDHDEAVAAVDDDRTGDPQADTAQAEAVAAVDDKAGDPQAVTDQDEAAAAGRDEKAGAEAAAAAETVTAQVADDSGPGDEDAATEAVGARADDDAIAADKPVAVGAAVKEPATADDIAAAMMQDLALEPPTSRAVSEPTVARTGDGQIAADGLASFELPKPTISSAADAILKQEFAEYLEPAAVAPPGPGPSTQPDNVAKITTDDWA